MKNATQPWIKPVVNFHSADSAEYKRLKALLDSESERIKQEEAAKTQEHQPDVSPQ